MQQEVKREWMDLTYLQMKEMDDITRKEFCLKMRKDYLKRVISPLLVNLPLHTGFKFSDIDENLSCSVMFYDLFKEYQKRSYTNDEIWSVIQGKRVKKR